MTTKNEINIGKRRFAACVGGVALLSMDSRTARRAPVSESSSSFHLSAGGNSRDRFRPVSHNSQIKNLKRCEIFRGKVPPRQTQKTQNHLEITTPFAPHL
jgi:hypothetical protein